MQGQDAGFSDFAKGAVPEYESVKRVSSGQGKPEDAMLLLYFLNFKAGKMSESPLKDTKPPEAGDPVEPTEGEGNANEGEGNTPEDVAPVEAPAEGEQAAKPGEDGKAYEKAVVRLELMEPHPPFTPGEGVEPIEFERQMRGQENGMNDLTVEDFLANRDAYNNKLAAERAAGKKNPSGRSTEGTKAQEAYRKEAIRTKAEELRNKDPNLSRKDALQQAKDSYSDKAALHDPDQIAGGHGTNITGMGDASVNFSIGSQWKTRIDGIDAQVRAQAANMTPQQIKTTKLNVRLYP